MDLKTLLQSLRKDLPAAVPDRHIEDLLCRELSMSWGELKLSSVEISQEQLESIRSKAQRMAAGEPLAYVVGSQFFYKSDFRISPSVLIPRPETEILVEKGLALVPKVGAVIFDLGSGSGCIGLSMAKELPQSRVHLFEASVEALDLSRENQKLLGLENVLQHHLKVGEEEWAEQHEQADLILANPPYIAKGDRRVTESVHRHEPHMALYADQKGLEWIHKWLLWSYNYLKPGGFFIFEFGAEQEEAIAQLSELNQYEEREFIEDYSGRPRFLKLKK